MLKRLLLIAVIVAPMAMSAQSAKFGVINTREVFQLMPERAAAEKELEETQKKFEDELLRMEDEYKKKYQEYIDQEKTMVENIKVRRMQEITELEQRIQNFREVAMQSIQQKQEQLLAPITKKLTDAIKEVGEAGAFTYVLDQNNILYAGGASIDITSQVKTKLGLSATTPAATIPAAAAKTGK